MKIHWGIGKTVFLFPLAICHQRVPHYIDVIMTPLASQISSLVVVYSIVYSGADQSGEFTGTGEFPAQRASNAENGSIWWRHHAMTVLWYAHMSEFKWPTNCYYYPCCVSFVIHGQIGVHVFNVVLIVFYDLSTSYVWSKYPLLKILAYHSNNVITIGLPRASVVHDIGRTYKNRPKHQQLIYIFI